MLRSLALRVRALIRRSNAERDLDDELRFHIERQTELYIRGGMAPDEARRRAGLEFGGVEQVKEKCRDERHVALVETLVQDMRYGLRTLARSPVFTAVAVLSLAIGIGANTAVFSLLDAVLLKTMPVRDPEQLRVLWWSAGKQGPRQVNSSYSHGRGNAGRWQLNTFTWPVYAGFRSGSRTLSDVIGFAPMGKISAATGGEPRIAGGLLVSGNYFSGLGAGTVIGRPITGNDDLPGAAPVAVISYQFWDRAFGLDPHIAGRPITINSVPFTIAGVTPREFFGISAGGFSGMPQIDISVPLIWKERLSRPLPEGESWFAARDRYWVQMIGRLKPGIDERAAQAELTALFGGVLAEPEAVGPEGIRVDLAPGGQGLDFLREAYRKPLAILMVTVGFSLLIACANVAGLLLARAAARQKELAVRLALGAGRLRIARQLLTESALLALAGGAAGWLLAWWGIKGLLALLAGGSDPIALDVRPDLRVLSFTAGVSILTGLLFGMVPAFGATRVDVAPRLKDEALLGGASARFGLGRALVAAQVAVCLLLLAGAGLFVRTLANLRSIDLGFNRDNVLLFGLAPGLNGYGDARVKALFVRVRERLQSVPGVVAASFSGQALIAGWVSNTSIVVDGNPCRVELNQAGPDFPHTMQIPLTMGRDIETRDTGTAPRVVVINESAAKKCFGAGSPLGRRFRWRGVPGQEVEVVGVVKDAKYARVQDEIRATLYVPYEQGQYQPTTVYFAVRTAVSPQAIVPAVRAAVREIDKDLPLIDVKTQARQIDESLAKQRLFATLVTLFGAIALALACVGLYGITAYAVVRRTREIGIRVALGALRADVLSMVLRDVVVTVVCGAVIGLPLALALTRFIRSQLYGVTPYDAVTFGAAAGIVIVVAALAGLAPAIRAARLDPVSALRHE